MKAYIVAHFHNGVIIEFKRKNKHALTPQPLSLTVATNAAKKLNSKAGENSPQDHWGVLTIDQLASIQSNAFARAKLINGL